MKCTIPEISWHNRDPVLSVDIQQCKQIKDDVNGKLYWRLATGGADSHVLIWHVTINELGVASVNCVAELNRHQKTVNVVRFSPSGEILATGDDESVIILWKHREGTEPPALPGEENINEEQWTSWKVLRGHLEDVYDISWSPDNNMLVSGSVDNTAIVWDVRKGRSISILQDYKGFVQGVSWDPCNQYITTLSTDRQCRLIDLNTMKTIQRVSKSRIPTPPGHLLENKIIRLFCDDTFKSYFRRLTFTIDGSLIIAPSGIIDSQESTDCLSNAIIIFSRNNIKEPIMVLPTLDEPTIAVRCCPLYFELRNQGPVALIALPYRLVFAVATQKSVFIYDTQQISPIAIISNIHYTRLTDVTWSSDGRLLVVSSTDGYCSIIHFQEGELGKIYTVNKPLSINSINGNIKSNVDEVKNDKKKNILHNEKIDFLPDVDNEAMDIDVIKYESTDINNKKCNLNIKNDKVSLVTTNEIQMINLEDTEDIKLVYNDTSNIETPKNIPDNNKSVRITPPKIENTQNLSVKTPRRVKLITISSPKRAKEQ
ncbi:chromatin assembly factor 1 subunit B [Microplitis demolitor]|uniref:chromatin assembly factor 1 subunit B n=1 Tax=Microplitis demolitor TaxID=69319 RepID=UPI0004CCB364|nr:chromatin assembly factor 1 subunit B [Microplitis demolitor]